MSTYVATVGLYIEFSSLDFISDKYSFTYAKEVRCLESVWLTILKVLGFMEGGVTEGGREGWDS